MSSKIDKIFYINLEKRTDRKEQIENQLNNFGLEYERFNAIYMPGYGDVGCALSHLEVLRIAKERNYKNILILEDDFEFLVDKNTFESLLNEFYSKNINYDVLFLSYNVIRGTETEYNFIEKGLEVQTASGYIVNSHYYDKLINLLEYSCPILQSTRKHWIYANDQIWKQFQEKDNWYYFIPRIGKQSDGYSNLAGRFVSYNC